ncbi:MAG: hypothetical protein ACJAS4_001613 [Bacteriovoracaceae bacterium]|jgi:hypothetical protein
MKAVLILAVSLFAFSASARTGMKNFTVSVSGETEQMVLDKVEMTIPQILTGKVRSVFQSTTTCWPTNARTVKVNSVSIRKSYKVDSYGNLNPYYTGIISYTHKKCRESNDR